MQLSHPRTRARLAAHSHSLSSPCSRARVLVSGHCRVGPRLHLSASGTHRVIVFVTPSSPRASRRRPPLKLLSPVQQWRLSNRFSSRNRVKPYLLSPPYSNPVESSPESDSISKSKQIRDFPVLGIPYLRPISGYKRVPRVRPCLLIPKPHPVPLLKLRRRRNLEFRVSEPQAKTSNFAAVGRAPSRWSSPSPSSSRPPPRAPLYCSRASPVVDPDNSRHRPPLRRQFRPPPSFSRAKKPTTRSAIASSTQRAHPLPPASSVAPLPGELKTSPALTPL